MKYVRKNWLKIVSTQLFLGVAAFFVFHIFFPSHSENSTIVKKKVELEQEPAVPLERPINYSLVALQDTMLWLESLQPGDTLSALMVINRVDRRNLLRLDSLLFPDTIGVGIDMYSPFPKTVDSLKSVHKIIFVSHFAQAFAVYENGRQIKWGPVNLGTKYRPTPVGLFATNWKAKRTTSTIDPSWILDWYFNISNFEGIGMHEYALPGYPASHGCVRMYGDDANWVYHWADQWIIEDSKIAVYGTPVVIFGEYPYELGKPWFKLAEDNEYTKISPAAMMKETKQFLPTILERQTKRDSVELPKLPSSV